MRVYADDEIKYPGGVYEQHDWWFWRTWSGRIAEQEMRDGGKTGPIDRRDLLILEAKETLYGPETMGPLPEVTSEQKKGKVSKEALDAAREIEELVGGIPGGML